MLGPVVHELRELVGLRPLCDHQELGGVVVQAARGQLVPHALRHERHHGVQQAHGRVQHEDEVALDLQLLLRRAVQQAALAELDVPVAHLVPEERLDVAGVVAKLVVLELPRGLGDHLREAAEHPRVLGRLGLGGAGHVAREVHLDKAARVPDLRHEGACLLSARAVDELLRLLVDVRVELDVLVVGDERQ